MQLLTSLLLCLMVLPLNAQNPLDEIVRERAGEFSGWASDPEQYEVQVLYSEIERGANGSIRLKTHRWGADSTRYFYPASTIKMPVAALTLQKLNELGVEGLNPQTLLFHGTGTAPASAPQTAVNRDTSSRTGYPSVEHYIRKIFLVSDNDAYNRLFELLGPTYINESLEAIGITGMRHQHRVGIGGFNTETHAWLNPVKFVNGIKVPYQIGERHDTFYRALPQVKSQVKGAVSETDTEALVGEPFDFSHKNYYSLRNLHDILARIVIPEAFPPEQRFQLTDSDYDLLRQPMAQLPRLSDYPRYDLPDTYSKFWMYGDPEGEAKIPQNLRIFSKAGWAYGYLTDVAYITDTNTGIEFILVGTIHTNRNRVYGDGKYEYEEAGFPFFRELGQAVMDYERKKRGL